jgi:adenylylsulfate kinase-like enzyme
MKNAAIFWLTGLSGAGKSTLAFHAKQELEANGLTILILDGDVIRESYKIKLGFGKDDIEKNNMNIMKICASERKNYDILIVPVISPIDRLRKTARKTLEPLFKLIHISCSIDSLRKRDPKGLYRKADKGEITDLIGYSKANPYEVPADADLKVDTSSSATLELSVETIVRFIKKNTDTLS